MQSNNEDFLKAQIKFLEDCNQLLKSEKLKLETEISFQSMLLKKSSEIIYDLSSKISCFIESQANKNPILIQNLTNPQKKPNQDPEHH